jgi:hypothetical protein
MGEWKKRRRILVETNKILPFYILPFFTSSLTFAPDLKTFFYA